MSAPDPLRQCAALVNEGGFLSVNKNTLQHVTFPNVFGIGDCTSVPTSKTAAAVGELLIYFSLGSQEKKEEYIEYLHVYIQCHVFLHISSKERDEYIGGYIQCLICHCLTLVWKE